MTRAKQAVLQKQESIAISLIKNGTDYTSYTWEIKSTDGYIYDFNQIETYHSYTGNSIDLGDHVSAWYLTKITSPNGNSITYNYISVPEQVTTAGSYSDSWDYAEPIVINPNTILQNHTYMSGNTGRQQGQVPGRIYNIVVLDNIDFNNGIVKFNYSTNREDLTNDRKLDSLSVFLKDANGNISAKPLRTITLSYDYFNKGAGDTDDDIALGTQAGTNMYERLRLLQVQQKGYYHNNTVLENPYVFTYNSQYSLPSKGSFARDHWGYYNGKTSNTSLIPTLIPVNTPNQITTLLGIEGTERDAVRGFVSAASLIGIQYPTGGSTEFQYESNDYDEQQSQVNDYSFFAKDLSAASKTVTLSFDNQEARTVLPSDTLDLSDEFMFTPIQNGTQTSPTVTLNTAFRFSNESSCGINPFGQLNLLTFDIYDLTGKTVLIHHGAAAIPQCSGSVTDGCMVCNSNGREFTFNSANLYLGPGKYLVKVYVDPSYASSLQDIHFNFSYYANVSSLKNYYNGTTTTYATGGGQRIVRIIDHPDESSSTQIRKYIYHYFSNKSGSNAEYSYGRRMSHPVYSSFLITADNTTITTPSNPGVNTGLWGLHMMRSADSDNPLNGSAAGAVVGYDQVTELNGENGENGKTVYKYINSPDTVLAYNDPAYGLPVQPPYGSNLPDLQNGSLLERTDYVNNQSVFVKLKDVTNTYGNMFFGNQYAILGLDVRPITINHVTVDAESGSTSSSTSTDQEDQFLTKYTAINSQFPYLASTDEKLFDQADTTKFYETSTSYHYDNLLHLMPTRIVTTNSKGENITTFNKYPLDYAITGTASAPVSQGIQFLQNNNVVSPVIEKYVQLSNADGTNARVTSAVFTSYKTNAALPDVIQSTTSVIPMTNFAPANIATGSATLDTRYVPYILFNQYDTYGNILQQQKANGVNNGYIWDYNSSFPIAEVKNAVQADIAYTSFEADGSGGWTIASATRDAANSMTGTQSYNLFSGSISKGGLISATTYVVSYWTKNSSPFPITGTVTGYPIKGATINGWTYYEHKVTAQPTITISGTGNIDELRLYPQNAQMTSYTYSPLIGVTTISDARGGINYYEYDGLGRLLDIKDQNGNIVKSFTYHYAGQ